MATGAGLRLSIKADLKNIARSKLSRHMACALCLEVVFSKDNPRDRIFAILPNCNHCFCLVCIRTSWNINPLLQTLKACAVCWKLSDFYINSEYWVEGQDKVKLIQKYKDVMATKPCSTYVGCSSQTKRSQTTQPWRVKSDRCLPTQPSTAQSQNMQPVGVPVCVRMLDVLPSEPKHDDVYTIDIEAMLLRLLDE